MNKEEIIKLLNILIGNIKPIGDSAIDKQSKENLELLISVAKEIHLKIDEVACMNKFEYASVRESVGIANSYLDWLGIEE